MKLGRIVVAGALGFVLVLGSVVSAEEPAGPTKPKREPKELLTDPHTDHAHGDAAVKKPEAKPGAEVKVSPEARAELDKLTEAYKGLKALEVAGTLSLDAVAGDDTVRKAGTFTGSFAAPNKFRHEMKGDMIVGSTGEKAYAFQPESNSYKQTDAPKDRVPAKKLPSPMREVLQQQNVALMCALVDDAGKFLEEGMTEISKGDDVAIDGTNYAALDFRGAEQSYRVLIDPSSHLIRRVYLDVKPEIKKRREDVQKALLTFDYTKIEPASAAEDKQFAWAPPEGSREAAASGGVGEGEAVALVGKDAPDFTLKGMDDKDVSLSGQRGQVVVLDFWATWCGPCRQSLPGLNAMYKELKEKGMAAFAVDLQEGKETIQPVKAKLIPDVPVLLDEKSDVAKLYGVSGIPQTVVIGKDGKVKKVFIGSGQEAKIKAAVEAALKE